LGLGVPLRQAGRSRARLCGDGLAIQSNWRQATQETGRAAARSVDCVHQLGDVAVAQAGWTRPHGSTPTPWPFEALAADDPSDPDWQRYLSSPTKSSERAVRKAKLD